MTKKELIEALQATTSPDDAEVIVWVAQCRRTVLAATDDYATGEPRQSLTLEIGIDHRPANLS